MAAYSLDLRLRVLRDADGGIASDELAEKYSVSRAWVNRLKQRRRETGEVAARKQTRWRTPILHSQLPQLEALIREQADRTLAELQEALQTPASLPTICRAVKQLGFRFKKTVRASEHDRADVVLAPLARARAAPAAEPPRPEIPG